MEAKPAPGDAGTDSGTDDEHAKALNAAEHDLRNHRKRKPEAAKPKQASAAEAASEAAEPAAPPHKRAHRAAPESAGELHSPSPHRERPSISILLSDYRPLLEPGLTMPKRCGLSLDKLV